MFKRLFALVLAFCMCFAVVGCKDDEEIVVSTDVTSSQTESTPEPVKYYTNPLTGEDTLTEEQQNNRPIAVMVNNVNVAQSVQTGVYAADIVYETEIEGGVTRLLAIYNDVTKVEKIGSVRSARYPYIDLALGHNAVYIHCGTDPTHAKPHLADIDNIDFNDNSKGSSRIKNGLPTEHTLYAYSSGIMERIESAGFKTTVSDTKTWQNFAEAGETVTLQNAATSVKIPFSYSTTFKYDAESGKYVRYCKDVKREDYFTKDATYVKNLFVLNTTIRNYNCSGCGKAQHRQVLLESGDGYYFVNGTYTPIKWSKGSSTNGFTFTNTDGSSLTVNAGNSWVCIAGMKTKPVIE